jgi:hypothetical protein
MNDVRSEIKSIEREIDSIKHSFAMGRLSVPLAKKRILELETILKIIVKKLPEHEQQLHAIQKEFGKEF